MTARCVHDRFRDQAARTPDAVAVIADDEQVGYGALAGRVDRLAGHLADLGVGAETLVGVCLPRSADMVAAVLAILAAGGAYVPLDPSYPAERLAVMVDGARPPVILTDDRFAPVLAAPGVRLVRIDRDLDRDLDRSARGGAGGARAGTAPDRLAYVMYTSGSTGRPKGVLVEHRGVVNLLAAMQAVLGLTGRDRWLAVTSLGFDIAALELFLPLMVGASVELVSAAVAADGLRLRERLARSQPTCLQATPATWRLLIDAGWTGGDAMRVLCGGEALSGELAAQLLARAPEVWNLYGPTETTIWSTVHRVTAGERPVPIGRPIADTTVHVLDGAMAPVPAGSEGELYLGGAGVARGYLGRAALTAERFVPDPSGRPGARLYRTGDLVRHRPDGALEFLGRRDHQVKIRGHRIELAEIEAALAGHAEVAEAVVVGRDDDTGGKRLVGYVRRDQRASDPEVDQQGLADWQMVFDQIYGSSGSSSYASYDIVGWKSSVTGKPIPADEMRHWTTATVDRISALAPDRVLEIGCGTGLLLTRIAPRCSHYVGTDLSPVVLDALGARLSGTLPQVSLLCRHAADFTGIAGPFDTVIVNSVAQYLPDAAYLVRVLRQAASLVRPGGHLFIGDVRHLDLLDTFHASVQLFQADPRWSLADLRRRIARRIAGEKELLLAPGFFAALRAEIPRISGVEIQLKRGRVGNELTRFRYDAILRIEGPAATAIERSIDGRARSLAWLAEHLAGAGPSLAVRGIPNARLADDLDGLARIRGGDPRHGTAGDVRSAVAAGRRDGVDPEDLAAVAARAGYAATLCWSAAPGCFDAVLQRGVRAPLVDAAPAAVAWHRAANDPSAARRRRSLASTLRGHLARSLPDSMIPSAFVFVDAMPLTPSGKVDRSALPSPDDQRPEIATDYAAPRTATEQALAAIWSDLLHIARIGIHDDFFELGGHSLLATQVVMRAREVLGAALSLGALLDGPTVAELAAAADRAGAPVAGALPPLVATPRTDEPIPLSFAQERLWALDQLAPGQVAYHVPLVVRLTSEAPLDLAAVERALGEVVQRHEVLRTRLPAVDGRPVQIIDPAGPPCAVIDLRGRPGDEQQAAIAAHAAEQIARPFDLARGPVLRATLLAVTEHACCLVLVIHHVAFDEWSIGVVTAELGALYAAFAAGHPSPLPAPAIQCADVARWQRRTLAEREALHLPYWRRQLAGVTELPLATDHPAPAVRTRRAGRQVIALPVMLADALDELAARERVTPFMVLVAGLQLLLHRHTGAHDVAIGSPIGHRARAETEPLIGLFLDTVVLRGDLSGDPSFRTLVARARSTTLAAHAHQDLPFEKLVEALRPARRGTEVPLFRVLLVLRRPPPAPALPGLTISVEELATGGAMFDLVVSLERTARGYEGWIDHDLDLIAPDTCARMAGHLGALLRGAIADPDAPASRLPLLAEAERRQLIEDWNQTSRALVPARGLHELFEAHAVRAPDAIAVIGRGERVGYGAIDRRANQLAHRLSAMGVGLERRVGLCLARSVDLAVCVLGVLKAGGVLVPLDPSHPPDRLAFLIEDAGLAVILVDGETRGVLPDVTAVPRIDLDLGTVRAALAAEPAAAPAVAVSGASAAWVFYTSGSTGRPKGVIGSHDSVRNWIGWVLEAFPVGAADRVLQQAALGFDVSVMELLWALASGAAAVLAGPEVRDPDALAALIRAEQVTAACFVPSLLGAWLDARGVESCASLRRVMATGEALPRHVVDAFVRRLGRARLDNVYGPTEAGAVTHQPCAPEGRTDPPGGPVPIGRPVANTRVYLLDAARAPVPIGVAGELHVGGAGVARGYLGRPGLTAERFVPDPFAAEPGARMYRTGDRARYLRDGAIEYLGRVDHQVKIRGVRIELAEIELALRRQAGVADAVVVARADRPGQPGELRLIAYVVADPTAPVDAGRLSRALAAALPAAMVPSAFVVLDALPLSPNGKVDRAALPAPDPAARTPAAPSPRDPARELVAQIFAELLGAEHAGPDDDFFALGGHSLLAIRLVSRLRRLLDADLALRDLFEARTVAGLTARIARSRRGDAGAAPIPRVPRDRPIALSHAQEDLWLIEQLSPARAAYVISPGGLRLRGPLDVAALAGAVQALALRHEVLRTRVVHDAGRPRPIIAAEPPALVTVIDVAGAADAEARALAHAQEEIERPFDLATGPLARFVVVRLGAHDHLLVLAMHHLITDDWSLGIVARELSALYRAALGAAPALPALPIQFADVAAWQRDRLHGALPGELAYWRAQLAGAPVRLELPIDRPRPALPSFRGGHLGFALGAELSRAIRELGRLEGTTPFMTLLAGFFVLLARYTGQTDLLVGSPFAQRGHEQTEGVIGDLLNLVVLRGDLGDRPSFRTLLGRIRATTIEAHAHAEAPFDQVVQALAVERDPGRNPLVQVTFVMMEPPWHGVDLPGVTAEPVELWSRTAKFDLTLAVEPRGDGFRGHLEYSADLFEPSTIERMAGHLVALLSALVGDPDAPVDRAAMMAPAERARVIAGGNDTAIDHGESRLIHELFRAQAARTPGAPAVVFEDAVLDYRALAARVGQLAGSLIDLGVGPEVRVGVCLPRSTDLVVALLAVLEAGGAYVPIDPGDPDDRRALVLDDAGAALVIASASTGAGLSGARQLRLPHPPAAIDRRDPVAPGRRAGRDHAAYVIFTSGSTGRPKGAINTHGAIRNRLLWMQSAYRLDASDRVLQKTASSFDVSVWEFFWPLITGAALVVAPPGPPDPASLVRLIQRHAVTTIHFVPSMLQVFLDGLGPRGPDACRSLRRVIASGEALPFAVQEAFFRRFPGVALHNLYGPTETAVDVTAHACRPGDPRGLVPIGRPIANTRIHLLDAQRAPVPVGVTGELYIGGAGVGRGYLGRPGLTAERFVPDPLGLEPGARLYRTGDLARYLADGSIDYVGRADHQVKLRGFRIELGEIEAALGDAIPGGQAAVVLRGDPAGPPQLVAYLVPPAGTAVDTDALRARLARRLPDYMVPAVHVVLEAFPRTASGKIDRRRLAATDAGTPPEGRDAAASVTGDPLAQRIVALCREVLGRDIAATDDFFLAGGNSLELMRLQARLAETCGVTLPFAEMFSHRTASELARLVEQTQLAMVDDAELGAWAAIAGLDPLPGES